LLKTPGVSLDQWHLADDLATHEHAEPIGLGLNQRDESLACIADIDPFDVKINLARFELGHGEEVFDKLEQASAGGDNVTEIAFAFG